MNTTQLKTYAPAARRAFMAAVRAQAARLGITAKGVQAAQVQGDVLLIGGQAFPRGMAPARAALVDRVKANGFAPTVEAIAYTWFNRFVAMRYMELHGYFDHGYRVLSHPAGQGRPEILDHAADIDLPGLDRGQAVALKLDGTKDEELYRLLLLAQCNALHRAMPFLFERIGDETELLLPGNLLHTDSLIRQLVEGIDEAAWQEIEIIGWLYQFYISEKKDQVIGKVVKSEDIPAATQLFTPNWIVKYMVQNSLGAQWLATYPNSPLKGQMDYYIEPAEQSEAVQAQLAAITPSTLNPEALTLMDPASGSGHILTEAYDLFKAIYLERGYRQRDVAQLILEKNLFGLDIDGRAAQLTGFALMMKGRADDRRLFERGVRLNVMALVDSGGLDADEIARGLGIEGRIELVPSGDLFPETLLQPMLSVAPTRDVDVTALRSLIDLFEHATTFGSLIQVPEALAAKLPALKKLSEWTSAEGTTPDWTIAEALKRLGPLVRQAEMLAAQYDAVVANPPYMGSTGMNTLVKKFAKDYFPNAKSDLFAISTERFLQLAKPTGFTGLMTPFSWMFLKSYAALRGLILEQKTLHSLVQPEYHAFFDSAYVSVCTFIIRNSHTPSYQAAFIKLSDFYGADLQPKKTLEAISNPDCGWFYRSKPDDFKRIPGSPLAYNAPESVLQLFSSEVSNSEVCEKRLGLCTGDNDRFLRYWHEVSFALIGFRCPSYAEFSRRGDHRYAPHNKGGAFRRWTGNNDFVIKFDSESFKALSGLCNRLASKSHYFRESLTWSEITSSTFSMRALPPGYTFNIKGPSIFCEASRRLSLLAYFNSFTFGYLLGFLNQTISTNGGDVERIPFKELDRVGAGCVERNAGACLEISQSDLDGYEASWDFQSLPLLTASSGPTPTLASSYSAWISQNRAAIAEMKRLEEENNRLFIDAYGLADELTPDVPNEQITLTVNPANRYGGNLNEEQLWVRFREDSMQELVSYAVGCMMGRYSLDEPGLIYAHSGNVGFDPSRYVPFPADDDGLLPLTDTAWFDDDAASRLAEFVGVAWAEGHLEANLTFLADNLSPRANESSRETVRRYLCDSFFKDHLQRYKKRPIYWLFSSGKQKAFQCLVYLHRYNEGTLARMRAEYVIPLQGKMAARLEQLPRDMDAATSTAQAKRLEKERVKLGKQQVELLAFDEQLRHYADMRITLDLDDGVKANYGKFGNLLAEVKAVTGSKAEDA